MDFEFLATESPAILRDASTQETVGRVEYRVDDGRFYLDYLWVTPARRGQGLARETLDRFTDHVRSEDAKVTPICGVARAMMTDDERYEDVLQLGR